MIRAARCALAAAMILTLWTAHSGVALGFEDVWLKDNVVIPVTLCGNELQTEANRIDDVRMINIRPFAETPYYYDPLIVLSLDGISSREINNLECVAISSNNTGDERNRLIRFGEIRIVGDFLLKIFDRRPSMEFVSSGCSPVMIMSLKVVIYRCPGWIIEIDLLRAKERYKSARLLSNIGLGGVGGGSLPINKAVCNDRCDKQEPGKDTNNSGPRNHFSRELFAYSIVLALSLAVGLWGLCHLMFSDKIRRRWPLWTSAALVGFVIAVISVRAMLP